MAKKRGPSITHKQLLSRLGKVRQETEAGTIFVPEQPILLEQPLDLAAAAQMGMETLLFCVWSGEDAWQFGRLSLVPLSDRSAAVTWEGADKQVQIVARLAPIASSRLWEQFLQDFLGSNGSGYGVSPLAALPNQMTNYRPDLFSRDALRAALAAYLEQTEEAGAGEQLDTFFDCCYEEESPG